MTCIPWLAFESYLIRTSIDSAQALCSMCRLGLRLSPLAFPPSFPGEVPMCFSDRGCRAVEVGISNCWVVLVAIILVEPSNPNPIIVGIIVMTPSWLASVLSSDKFRRGQLLWFWSCSCCVLARIFLGLYNSTKKRGDNEASGWACSWEMMRQSVKSLTNLQGNHESRLPLLVGLGLRYPRCLETRLNPTLWVGLGFHSKMPIFTMPAFPCLSQDLLLVLLIFISSLEIRRISRAP